MNHFSGIALMHARINLIIFVSLSTVQNLKINKSSPFASVCISLHFVCISTGLETQYLSSIYNANLGMLSLSILKISQNRESTERLIENHI